MQQKRTADLGHILEGSRPARTHSKLIISDIVYIYIYIYIIHI